MAESTAALNVASLCSSHRLWRLTCLLMEKDFCQQPGRVILDLKGTGLPGIKQQSQNCKRWCVERMTETKFQLSLLAKLQECKVPDF